mgnify:CR=1 FL=1
MRIIAGFDDTGRFRTFAPLTSAQLEAMAEAIAEAARRAVFPATDAVPGVSTEDADE